MERLGLPTEASVAMTTTSEPIEMDFRRPDPADELSEQAKVLYDQGLLQKEIAARLKCSEPYVIKLLKHWSEQHRVELPNAYERRCQIAHERTPPLYVSLAPEALRLSKERKSTLDIALQLGCCGPDTILRHHLRPRAGTAGTSAAVKMWTKNPRTMARARRSPTLRPPEQRLVGDVRVQGRRVRAGPVVFPASLNPVLWSWCSTCSWSPWRRAKCRRRTGCEHAMCTRSTVPHEVADEPSAARLPPRRQERNRTSPRPAVRCGVCM